MPRKDFTIFEAMSRRRGQRSGHLYSRSGTWLLRYWVDSADVFKDDGTPERDRITVTVARSNGPDAISRREAERVAWETYLSPLDAASTRPSSGKPFLEFVNKRFRPDVIETLKPAGKTFYECILRKHVLPALGSVKLRDITVERVQGLLTVKGRTGLSTQTVVHIRNCISAVLRHAKAMQWYFGELPTSAVRLPEMVREVRMAPNWEQICLLAAAVPEPVATLIPFLALTGLRIGEAMGLRIGRLNLTPERLYYAGEVIHPMSIAVRENYVLGDYQTLKTASSCRNVPIPEWFAPRLVRMLVRKKFTAAEDPVFVSRNGRPLDQHNQAARILKPAARALKMEWISWHCLRHAHASLADAAGFSVAERQKVLGHASDAMAMHYTGADLERMRPRLEGMVDQKLLH